MNRGFYIAGTGMYIERQRMDVISQNAVNVETAGYKQDTLISRSFKDALVQRINDPGYAGNNGTRVGNLNYGVHIDEVFTNFTQGAMDVTERPLDFAIEGDALFVIDTPAGERYTRNGSFYVDPQGALRTSEGYAVMGEDGPIVVPTDEFGVNTNGQIVAGGQIIGKFKMVTPGDWKNLRKVGSNLYASYNDAPVTDATSFQIRQGSLENSNVDMAREMVNMITSSRTYETNQKMLRMIDETLDKAVNRIATVG